ncbi:peptidoglycan DD-metalloendopeptidase family protein [Georgenia subflava]|uniref:peptidoglycan DD-metalloendopeptidase family protein n=1 Tax=Georgenia subflava TaxID=1622177 RepID=UPI00186AD423|nr:peptidoglycan DD-metalloendopeptidase family protein [Georgenia subflava]
MIAAAVVALQPAVALAAPPSGGGVVGPLDSGSYALTSYQGPRCLPIIHASTYHGGQDLGAAAGSTLYAIADGRIVQAKTDPVAGEWLLVEHQIGGQRIFASYSHTLDADRFVRVGDAVHRGQKIAEVGSTGVSTAPHLHLEIWRDGYLSGTRIDPLDFFRSHGVDLATHATRVVPRVVPSSCRYYAVGTTKIHASASTGSQVLTTVPHHAAMTSKPGTKSNGFLPVTTNGVTGWADDDNVSPTKLGLPDARIVRQVSMRTAPGADAAAIAGLSAGTAIDDVVALSNGWYLIEAGGKRGWVPRGNVELEPAADPGINYGFFLANSFTTAADTVFDYGEYFDEFFVGDWDGDGEDTLAYRRGRSFYLRDSNFPGEPDRVIHYGRPGDTVLVGDWDGDGVDTFAVRRGMVYHVKNSVSSGPADAVVPYGRAGDTIMVGDFDGNGGDTLAVRRGPEYHIKNSMSGGKADQVVVYGRGGDDVLVGDWDGDGDDTLAVRRGAEYHIKNTIAPGNADIRVVYGRSTDEVYVGDWDADGRDSLAVYRY